MWDYIHLLSFFFNAWIRSQSPKAAAGKCQKINILYLHLRKGQSHEARAAESILRVAADKAEVKQVIHRRGIYLPFFFSFLRLIRPRASDHGYFKAHRTLRLPPHMRDANSWKETKQILNTK